MSTSATFTVEDVARHSTRNDLYLIVHNNVYDLSEYAHKHPGGESLIFDLAGQDASEAFEDVGHSNDARKDLEEHLVGQLEVEVETVSKTAASNAHHASMISIIENHKTPFTLAILILVYFLVTGVIKIT